MFLTLEDETGGANIVVWPRVYEQFRRPVMGGRLLKVTGLIQREGVVVHVIAEQIEDWTQQLLDLAKPMPEEGEEEREEPARRPRQGPSARHPREQAKRLFQSRDFH